jgi:hypothetical protein
MNLTKAFNILRHHQLWRLGEEITQLHPKQLTEAIDVILKEQKKLMYSEEDMGRAILFAFDTFSESLSRREMELRAKDFIESLKKK